MTAAIELLDKYKQVCGIDTDMAAADRLGLVRATISMWRHGKTHPSAHTVRAMCEACGEVTIEWLPRIEAARTSNPESKAAWLSVTKDAIRARIAPTRRHG
jgi:transcriptional regulator with XRE-family HTH domain